MSDAYFRAFQHDLDAMVSEYSATLDGPLNVFHYERLINNIVAFIKINIRVFPANTNAERYDLAQEFCGEYVSRLHEKIE